MDMPHRNESDFLKIPLVPVFSYDSTTGFAMNDSQRTAAIFRTSWRNEKVQLGVWEDFGWFIIKHITVHQCPSCIFIRCAVLLP